MQEWVTLSDMTLARTEHGLAVINDIPTVVGGVAEDEFLASVEQLDSSNDQDLAYQRQWRLVAQVRGFPADNLSSDSHCSGSLCPEIRLWSGSDTNQQSQQTSRLQISVVTFQFSITTSRFLDLRILDAKPKNHYLLLLRYSINLIISQYYINYNVTAFLHKKHDK